MVKKDEKIETIKRPRCPECEFVMNSVYITHHRQYRALDNVFFCVKCMNLYDGMNLTNESDLPDGAFVILSEWIEAVKKAVKDGLLDEKSKDVVIGLLSEISNKSLVFTKKD